MLVSIEFSIIFFFFFFLRAGGHRGFSKVMWDVKEKDLEGPYPFVKFHYHSFDGEQGAAAS